MVLIIAVFALVLLAGLVFYLLNTGRHVQRRVETQHAADTAAEAAATRLARGFNTIAQNQVATARSLALVNMLDATPDAVRFTLADQRAVFEAATGQIQRSAGGSRRDALTREALVELREDVRLEIALLETVDAVINGGAFDLRTVTFYDPPAGQRGWLWRAMLSLDAVSRATAETLPDAAAQTGIESGLRHLRGGEAAALAAPLERELPIERGDFADFQRPVSLGLLPEAIDDPVRNRGPWDAVFGRRDPIGGMTFVRGSGSNDGGGSGAVPIGTGAGSGRGGIWVRTDEPTSYRVLGPQAWMLRSLHHMTEASLPHSRFAAHVREQAEIKLGYFRRGGDAATLERVVDPAWETRFNEAVRLASRRPSPIRETGFIAVEIKSRYPPGDPRYLQDDDSWTFVRFNYGRGGGAWSSLDRTLSGARLVVVDRWIDPRTWGVPRVNNYTWRDQWSYRITYDSDLGIERETDEDGNVVWQPVYRSDDFIFLGVNTGEEIDVRNPHNWSAGDELPAPYRFAEGTPPPNDPAAAREALSFFGVARQRVRSPFWSDRFDAGRPRRSPIAVAQADVFNNHSWDLWTPMWHARLRPVEGYDRWLDALAQAEPAAARFDGLDPALVAAARDQLEAAAPLADELMP